jgi:hypothetical protein
LSESIDGGIGRHAEAALMRKRTNQKRHMLVMHGRIEQLIRYVLTTPEANRKQYKLVFGNTEYGLSHIKALAGKFGIRIDDTGTDAEGRI